MSEFFKFCATAVRLRNDFNPEVSSNSRDLIKRQLFFLLLSNDPKFKFSTFRFTLTFARASPFRLRSRAFRLRGPEKFYSQVN